MLRRQRTERGALQLASPEVKFEIDTETHDPLDVGMYQVRPGFWPGLHRSLDPPLEIPACRSSTTGARTSDSKEAS